jgi:hypothetical protein
MKEKRKEMINMKVKEILNLTDEQLEKMMTEEQFERMQKLGFEYTWQFLDTLKDSARSSGQDENEEHVTIDTYLDYLEDMKD